jgi:Ribonuclease G/E
MSQRLLVSALPGELRAARVDAKGRLLDFLVQRGEADGAVGDLWAARVLRLQKNLGAFLDLGGAKAALLDWGDVPAGTTEGTALCVRVSRLPQDGKGAKVKPATAAVPADVRLPCRLARGDSPLALLTAEVVELACDEEDAYARLNADLPDGVGARLVAPRPPLFDAALEEQAAALLTREVPLPGGGRLLIEPVETLTAIDVDAGGGPGGLETNLAAAPRIAREVRLRALSGLVVVDFLEMRSRGQRDRLHAALSEAFAGDPVETAVFPPLPSGLVEIARQRTRPALHEVLCRNAGWQPSPQTLAYAALRRLLAAPPTAHPSLELPAAAIAALEGPLAPARAAVEARLGTSIALQPVPAGDASAPFC